MLASSSVICQFSDLYRREFFSCGFFLAVFLNPFPGLFKFSCKGNVLLFDHPPSGDLFAVESGQNLTVRALGTQSSLLVLNLRGRDFDDIWMPFELHV